MKSITDRKSSLTSKRRVTAAHQLQTIKNFKTDLDVTKDIFQLLKEQFVNDAQSIWKNSEILYVIPISKKGKGNTNALQDATIAATATAAVGMTTSNSSKFERYFVILRRPDLVNDATILKIFRKENELTIRSNFQISALKGIDYGSEEQELALSFDISEVSFYFFSQAEKDEVFNCAFVVQLDQHFLIIYNFFLFPDFVVSVSYCQSDCR